MTRALADKVSGFFKLFQARMSGTIFYSHGAISCWRRELLGQEILYHHDTEFHGIYECPRTLLASHKSGAGEDMFMGLLLHRLSQKKERRLMIDVTELLAYPG